MIWHPILPIFCFSHTLDKPGTLLYDEYVGADTCYFFEKLNFLANFPSFQKIWKRKYGKMPMHAQGVCWRVKDDKLKEVFPHWRDLGDIFNELKSQKSCVKTIKGLCDIYMDPIQGWQVAIEFALLLDVCLPFYSAMYLLEGDVFLVPIVMDQLNLLELTRNHFNVSTPATHTRVCAVAHSRYPVDEHDNDQQVREDWVIATLATASPVWNYFHETVMQDDAEMEPEHCHFEGAQLFHPGLARLQSAEMDIRPQLKKVSFLAPDNCRDCFALTTSLSTLEHRLESIHFITLSPFVPPSPGIAPPPRVNLILATLSLSLIRCNFPPII